MMNLYCVFNTVQSVIYKLLVLQQKVTLLEYVVIRNLVVVLFSIALLTTMHIDPWITLPSDKRAIVVARGMTGVVTVLLINWSLELIPFSLMVILFQTTPFWTSVLSFFVNKEPIFPVDLVGMILCFVAVFIIATNNRKDHAMLDTVPVSAVLND